MLVAGLALALVMHLNRPIRLVDLAAIALPAAAIAGWWFVRNLITFGGLVPPLQPLTTTHPYLRSLGELQVFASGAVRSVFGPERADGGALPRSFPVQVLIGVLFTMLALALVFAAVQAIRQHSKWDRRSRQIAMVFAAICGLLFAEWVLNSVLFDLQPQARYLFVAAAGPATALAWIGAMLVERVGRRVSVVLGSGLIVAMVFITVDSLRVAVTRNA